MIALGATAFERGMTPESLYRSATLVQDEHPVEAEELAGFAHDLATIRGLPETLPRLVK